MSLANKYPILLVKNIAETPATQDELDAFDVLFNHKYTCESFEESLAGEKIKANYVVLRLTSILSKRVPGAMDALERTVSLYRKLGIVSIHNISNSALKDLKRADLVRLVPRVANLLGASCWEVMDALYDHDIHDRVINCPEWDSFVSRTICACLDKARDSAAFSFNLNRAMCILDHWTWDNKTDVLDTLFSRVQDQTWLLAFASQSTHWNLVHDPAPGIEAQSDSIRRRFADKIATWAFYGIRQEQLPNHTWLPVEFPSAVPRPLGDNKIRRIKVFPICENTVAVDEFLRATTRRVWEEIRIEPVTKLVMTYFAP